VAFPGQDVERADSPFDNLLHANPVGIRASRLAAAVALI
jgi:hypothetical protein